MPAVLWAIIILAAVTAGWFRGKQALADMQSYQTRVAEGETVTISGTIQKKEFKNEKYRYYLEHMILYVEEDGYRIGDRIRVTGKVYYFSKAVNEGMFDSRAFYASQGYFASMSPTRIGLLGREKVPWREWLYQMRGRITRALENAAGICFFEERDAGVVSSMVLGEKSSMDAEVKELYQTAGISHMLAISGLHVSILGMGVYRMLRRRGLPFLMSGILSGVWILGYGQMVGNSVSTRRAVGMLLLTMAANCLGRRTDLLNSLGIMCLTLLWENPMLIGYSGFLFSVTALLGVGVTGKTLQRVLRTQRKLPQNLLMGIGITATTLPLVAWCYSEVPGYGILVNLLVSPLAGPLLLFGGIGGIAGLWSSRLAAVLLTPAAVILRMYEILAKTAGKLPGAQILTGKPALWKCVLYYLLLCAVLLLIRYLLQTKRRGAAGAAAGGILLCLALLAVHGGNTFELDVLDVGQGDGIYLASADGTAYFFDGGSSSEKQVGTYRILPFLKSKAVARVDYWVVSHTDEDHISGLREVLQAGYPVGYLILSPMMQEEEKTSELKSLAEENGTNVVYMMAGDRIRTEKGELYCLYPDNVDAASDVNDGSLVVRYQEGEFLGIFGGDISAETEEVLVENQVLQPVLFYKADHHGSRYSSSSSFLQAISPQITVISCSARNRYGHPAAEAVARIEDTGSAIFYTMKSGQITLRIKEKEGTVSTFRKGAY